MKENLLKKNFSWQVLFNILVIIFTLVMIAYFCFSDGGLFDLIQSNEPINIPWLFVAIVAHLFNMFIDMTVIYIFIKNSMPEFKFRQAFKVSMVGQFFCAVTPSSTGGQPMQIAMLNSMKVHIGQATSALIQKFLVWQFVLMGYSIFAVCMKFSLISESMGSGVLVLTIIGFTVQCAMCAALILASFATKFTSKLVGGLFNLLSKLHIVKNPEEKKAHLDVQLNTFHDCNRTLYKNKKIVVQVFILTFLQMTAFFLVPYFVGLALNSEMDAPALDMLCVQAFVNMVSSLMPLPGGSGAAEFCFAAFFGSYFTESTIKSAILIWRTITYYGTIFISAPFSGMSRKKKTEQQSESTEKNTPQ